MDGQKDLSQTGECVCMSKGKPSHKGRGGRNVLQIGRGWGECLTSTQGLGDESILGKRGVCIFGEGQVSGKANKGGSFTGKRLKPHGVRYCVVRGLRGHLGRVCQEEKGLSGREEHGAVCG